MLKAVIIDDEPDCVKLLALQLKMYCPHVEVVAECTESETGYTKIKELQPDIVLPLFPYAAAIEFLYC